METILENLYHASDFSFFGWHETHAKPYCHAVFAGSFPRMAPPKQSSTIDFGAAKLKRGPPAQWQRQAGLHSNSLGSCASSDLVPEQPGAGGFSACSSREFKLIPLDARTPSGLKPPAWGQNAAPTSVSYR